MCIHQDSVLPDVFADIVIMYCWAAPASGGESLLCDNRRFLSLLREQRPDLHDFFTTARIRYKNHTPNYYATDKVDQWIEKPTLRLHPLLQQPMVYFAFNDVADEHRNFTAVFADLTEQESDAKMAELGAFMRSPEVMIEHQLRAGDLIMFDNLLISHGRNAFPADESRLLSRVQIQLAG
jgi:alpha-ketoglutarate-dependent taurine dioxygenase